MEIPYEGKIDLPVLRQVTRLQLFPTRSRAVIVGCIALLMVWSLLLMPLTRGASFQELLPGLVPLAVLALLALTIPLSLRRVLDSNKQLQAPLTGAVTDQGLRIATLYGSSQLPWDVFYKVTIGRDVVLLYQSVQVCNVLHRRFFAGDAEWRSAVDLIRSHVTQKPPRSWGKQLLTIFMIWVTIFVLVILFWNFFKSS